MDPNWITISPADLDDLDVAPRIAAAKTAALAAGQDDPVPTVIADVTELVRGYVAGRYRLGTGATVPSRLKTAAMDIIVYRLLSRIGKGSPWEQRNRDAIALLKETAAGRFTLVDPVDAATDSGSGRPAPYLSATRPGSFGRTQQDGI